MSADCTQQISSFGLHSLIFIWFVHSVMSVTAVMKGVLVMMSIVMLALAPLCRLEAIASKQLSIQQCFSGEVSAKQTSAVDF